MKGKLPGLVWLIFLCFPFSGRSQVIVSGASVCIGSALSATVTGVTGAASFSWSSVPAAVLTGTSTPGNSVAVQPVSCGLHSLSCDVYNSSNSLIATSTATFYADCSTISISPPVSTICPNTNHTLTASGATSYSWAHGPTTATVPVSPPVTALYQVFNTSGVCSATALLNVFNPTVSASQSSLCPNTTVTLSVAGATNYSWYDAQGNFVTGSSATVAVAPGSLPTSYSVFSTWQSCLAFKTITLGLFSFVPKASVPSSVCTNITASLIATAGNAFTWTAANNFSTGPTYTVSQVAPANYTLMADSAGCKGTRIFSVGIFPQPTLAVAAPFFTICGGQTTSLTLSGALSYTWTLHPSLLSSIFSPSVVVSPTMMTVYTVTGTDANGCRSMIHPTVHISYYPQLVISASATSVCPGFSATLAGSGALSYTWAGPGGVVPTATLLAGSGTYTLRGSNGGSCRDSSVISIATLPPLQLTTTQSSPGTCRRTNGEIEPVHFSASGASSFTWQPYTPGQITYTLGGFTSVTPSVTTCYTVQGATAVCSGSAELCVVWGNCVGLHDEPYTTIRLFPNPFSEIIVVENADDVLQIVVMDVYGHQLAVPFVRDQSKFSIKTTDFAPGVYYCEFLNKCKPSITFKIIKE